MRLIDEQYTRAPFVMAVGAWDAWLLPWRVSSESQGGLPALMRTMGWEADSIPAPAQPGGRTSGVSYLLRA